MDPNETLNKIRLGVAQALQLADEYEADDDPPTHEDAEAYIGMLDELAQQFQALDDWLTRGGFPPEAWREGPDAPEERAHHYTRAEIVDGSGFAAGQTFTADPLGPPNPAHGELPGLTADYSRLPMGRDDDYTPAGIDRTTD